MRSNEQFLKPKVRLGPMLNLILNSEEPAKKVHVTFQLKVVFAKRPTVYPIEFKPDRNLKQQYCFTVAEVLVYSFQVKSLRLGRFL